MRGWSPAIWIGVVVVGLAGVALRVEGLAVCPLARAPCEGRWRPDRLRDAFENDERIYLALVDNLEQGRGYTLRAHPLLSESWVNRAQYDRPLFFHPPGGPAMFATFDLLLGAGGPAIAQVVSFLLFFAGTLILGYYLLPTRTVAPMVLAVLASMTPIMAHVTGRLWLDGPLLGWTTMAAAALVAGAVRRSNLLVVIAGVLLGAAMWIKATALVVTPGALAIAIVVAPTSRAWLTRVAMTWLGVAALVYAPWIVWQWVGSGEPFPEWAGRPDAVLVADNAYVRYLTAVRSPWIYIQLLPQILWTLVPGLIIWAMHWPDGRVRSRGGALIVWIATVVAAHVGLGMIGYSKVIRYVVVVTPAVVLLAALTADTVVERIRARRWIAGSPMLTAIVVLAALAGIVLEMEQGVRTAFEDNARMDLIRPLSGLPGITVRD